MHIPDVMVQSSALSVIINTGLKIHATLKLQTQHGGQHVKIANIST